MLKFHMKVAGDCSTKMMKKEHRPTSIMGCHVGFLGYTTHSIDQSV